jgi:hypothetical protein
MLGLAESFFYSGIQHAFSLQFKMKEGGSVAKKEPG